MRTELKVKTDDIDAFGKELERFVKEYLGYSKEVGLQAIYVGEWKAPYPVSRSIDRLGQFSDRHEARSWGITFIREKPSRPKVRGAPNMEVIVSISKIGGEYPLLLSISPSFPETRLFLMALIERCKQLWDGIPLKESRNESDVSAKQVSEAEGSKSMTTDVILQNRTYARPVDNGNLYAGHIIEPAAESKQINKTNRPEDYEKSASKKVASILPSFTPEQQLHIDEACKAWAGRGYLPDFNMSEFLSNYFENTNIYLSIDQFKRALRYAGKRGLIVKINGRWRLPESNN